MNFSEFIQESFILHIKVGWNRDENIGSKDICKMECRELGDSSSKG